MLNKKVWLKVNVLIHPIEVSATLLHCILFLVIPNRCVIDVFYIYYTYFDDVVNVHGTINVTLSECFIVFLFVSVTM